MNAFMKRLRLAWIEVNSWWWCFCLYEREGGWGKAFRSTWNCLTRLYIGEIQLREFGPVN